MGRRRFAFWLVAYCFASSRQDQNSRRRDFSMHILFLEDYITPRDIYGVENALLDKHLLAAISMRNRE